MSSRRSTLRYLPMLCALAFLWASSCVSAQAAVTHRYLSQITEEPAGSGAPLAGPVTALSSMTVDSGDLWVTEHVNGTDNSRVDEFDSAGNFVSQLNETDGIESLQFGIAVGHLSSETQIYVGALKRINGEPDGVVTVFAPTGRL